MTVGLSAAVLNAWLDSLEGISYTPPAGFWVQLHTGDPGSAGTANVSSVTTRQAIAASAFNPASGGSKTTTANPCEWTDWAGSTETIGYVSFHSASTGGTFLGSAQASTAKTVAAGDTLRLTGLTITITPVAA